MDLYFRTASSVSRCILLRMVVDVNFARAIRMTSARVISALFCRFSLGFSLVSSTTARLVSALRPASFFASITRSSLHQNRYFLTMGRRSNNGTPVSQRNLNKPKVDLYKHSINLILKHQLPNGAYPASPCYETYRYCWFRDGAYNAYAMDVVGHSDSAKMFFNWALGLIVTKRDRIEGAIAQGENFTCACS